MFKTLFTVGYYLTVFGGLLASALYGNESYVFFSVGFVWVMSSLSLSLLFVEPKDIWPDYKRSSFFKKVFYLTLIVTEAGLLLYTGWFITALLMLSVMVLINVKLNIYLNSLKQENK